jgi:hypothetical protein
MVDAELARLDLSKAKLCEWCGYLVLLCDGKIFLADSRQRFSHQGHTEYEWYYLEGIGIWEGQFLEYTYSSYMPEVLKGKNIKIDGNEYDFALADEFYWGASANLDDYGNAEELSVGKHPYDGGTVAYILKGKKAILVESKGNHIGGTFSPACSIKVIDNNIYFGTDNGHFCCFNFDKREPDGTMPISAYNFDERTILCGCALKMDNCGIPHLTKNTVRKSTVVKTKVMGSSAAKIKVRTNNVPYNQIARINSSSFSFDGLGFDELTFLTTEQTLFAVQEKEKRWVEKQYYIYSDEYMKPFSLYYVTYRYCVAGRYKEVQ